MAKEPITKNNVEAVAIENQEAVTERKAVTEKLTSKADAYFEHYPGVHTFFETTDGQFFQEKQWAETHQKNIDDNETIITHHRQ